MSSYRIRPVGRWPKNGKGVVLGISIGHSNHVGEKLSSMVSWIGKNFATAHIAIGDTLLRHNRMFLLCESIEQAATESRLEGDRWLVENAPILQSFTIPYTISRWNQWICDARFPASLKGIRSIYTDSVEARNAVHQDAERFLANLPRKGATIFDYSFALRKCVDLILEENAVFALRRLDYPYIEVYPGEELLSTQKIRNTPIEGALPSFYERTFTRLEFRRRGNGEKRRPAEVQLPTAANE